MVRWIACLLVVGLAACGGDSGSKDSADAGQMEMGEAAQEGAAEDVGAAAMPSGEAAEPVEEEAGEAAEEAEEAPAQAQP